MDLEGHVLLGCSFDIYFTLRIAHKKSNVELRRKTIVSIKKMFTVLHFRKVFCTAVAVALTFVICHSPLVTAQQFTNCVLDSADPDVTLCTWSSSPLVLSDGIGGTFTLGDSTLVTFCNTGGSFTTFNCDCGIYVDDDSGVFDTDNYCNSCTLLSLTTTSFSIYWDCSNRLTGNCPIIDANGCRTGDDDPTPFPVEAPTDFPTDPPEDDPTPFPVEAPTDFPTDPPELDPTPSPVDPADFPTEPPASTPVREPTLRNIKSPIRSPSEDTESETSRSTTSGGNSHRFHRIVGIVSSLVVTVTSIVFLV